MTYRRIEPFPSPDAFQSSELAALSAVWLEKKTELEKDGAYREFVKKLQREWAIETGIIERLYTWDRGVTEALIEQGIESSIIAHQGGLPRGEAEQVRTLIVDHLAIIEGLFGYIKGEQPLTESFIRGLQAQFTAHQDSTEAVTPSGDLIQVRLLKGEYKRLPNNPRRDDGSVHVYAPPEITKEEMEGLIAMYQEAEPTHSPETKAAWLHHRFTQIHPFQDGNGRVARALASLVFLREGLFPLLIRESDRTQYIGALERADQDDLGPLVALFARRQRDAILKALGLEQQVQQSKHADQIISSALQILRDKYSKEKAAASVVYEHADNLLAIASQRVHDLTDALLPQLRAVTPPGREKYLARWNSAGNTSEQRHYFYKQIVAAARKFDYFANFDVYRSWVRASLITDKEFDYVISFHGYGTGETGVLAASAFTYLKAPREEGGTEAVSLHPAATDLFQFNYVEPYESTQKRFAEWIESSIAIALAEWQRSL